MAKVGDADDASGEEKLTDRLDSDALICLDVALVTTIDFDVSSDAVGDAESTLFVRTDDTLVRTIVCDSIDVKVDDKTCRVDVVDISCVRVGRTLTVSTHWLT
jgi:hypothetical protein